MTRYRVFVGFLFLVLLSGCGPAAVTVLQRGAVPIQLVSPDGRIVTVSAELARTPAEQQRGLMGRTSLADGSGMLFIFPENAMRSFWMKNTLIPLDIIFFDDAGLFVSQATMVPCPAGGECPFTLSEGPARFALEIPTGFVQKAGIARDWRLMLGSWIQDS
ncbi:MAG: DUF192 domain-containing protein [Candidatus Peribacteraceae bacterium]|nr:DUF192 domain-containing protein [Candidatus Peribacteraceae bacterium]MDD5739347.1 DUF192 domain-containing protein [Candidatus Peribacteraceae bacterium]